MYVPVRVRVSVYVRDRAVCVLFSLIFISLFVRVAAAAASNQHCFDLAAVPATD